MKTNIKNFSQFINEGFENFEPTNRLSIPEIISRFESGEISKEEALANIKNFSQSEILSNGDIITSAFSNKPTERRNDSMSNKDEETVYSILRDYNQGTLTKDQAINQLRTQVPQSVRVDMGEYISKALSDISGAKPGKFNMEEPYYANEDEVYEAKKKSRKEVLKDADEKYPNLKKGSMKKGLEKMKGKDFKEKAKKNFAWADKPEAAAASYMRKATGKEPKDI